MRAGRTIKQAAIYPYEGLGHRCGADRQSAVSERTGEPASCVDRFLEETKRGAGPRSLGRAGADERRDQHGRNVQAACFHLGQHFEAIHLGIWRSQIRQPVRDTTSDARNAADANSRASPPSERTKLPAAARAKGSSSTMDTRSEAESEKGIPAYGEGTERPVPSTVTQVASIPSRRSAAIILTYGYARRGAWAVRRRSGKRAVLARRHVDAERGHLAHQFGHRAALHFRIAWLR